MVTRDLTPTTNNINGPLGKNVVLDSQFIIILALYALNNKNTPAACSAKHVISACQSKCQLINLLTILRIVSLEWKNYFLHITIPRIAGN